MYQVKTINNISPLGLAELAGDGFTVGADLAAPDGILVRSADLLSAELPENLLAIARAGAGTNNIPIDRCSEAGIAVFNTPGANANAVKELTVCALFLASRRVGAGIRWVDEQVKAGVEIDSVVEQGKKQFVGPEITGKTLGVIGLGAIGVQVANTANKLGMKVLGYDPYLSVDAALSLSHWVQRAMDLDTIYKNCDYITLHLPLSKATENTLNAAAFAKMKDGARILNLARGGLVSESDLLDALHSGKVAAYVTDFPTNALAAEPNVTAIPHLGASTPDSEENCAVMAARELREYLETGNIRHSVNLPELEQPWSGIERVCLIHRNTPGMLSSITAAISKEGVNVENLTNKSRGDYAYTVVDVNAPVQEHTVGEFRAIPGVLRVRVLER